MNWPEDFVTSCCTTVSDGHNGGIWYFNGWFCRIWLNLSHRIVRCRQKTRSNRPRQVESQLDVGDLGSWKSG